MTIFGTDTVRSWDSVLNTVISDGILTSLQTFQLAGFNLIQAFLAAGYTVNQSCGLNGGGPITAGPGNNIQVATDIVSDTNGNPHSWIELQHTTAVQGGTIYILLTFEDNLDPRNIMNSWVAPNAFTGGSTTLNPVAVDQVIQSPSAWCATTGGNPNAKIHYGWSDAGDMWCFITEDGSASVRASFLALNPDLTKLPISGGPSSPVVATCITRNQSNPSQMNIFSSPGGSHALPNVGQAPDTLEFFTPASYMSGFTNGQTPATSRSRSVWGAYHTQVAPGRYLGRIVDIMCMPNQTPMNRVQTGDTDTFRYVAFRTFNASGGPAFWVPVRASQLPILA